MLQQYDAVDLWPLWRAKRDAPILVASPSTPMETSWRKPLTEFVGDVRTRSRFVRTNALHAIPGGPAMGSW